MPATQTATGTFSQFLPICKVDKEQRTVSGYASTPAIDSDGEIVALKAIKAALPRYMEYGNIREMHRLNAVGVTKEANIDEKGLYITAKIVDDAAWQKCLEGVYKGFSIGGAKLAKTKNIITEVDLSEISVVDRPANPECKIDVIKAAKQVEGGEAKLVKVKQAPEQKAVVSLAKAIKMLTKGSVEEPFPQITEPPEDVRKAAEAAAKKPYGDVEYADPGTRPDGKHRYPIDTPEHIRAAWNYINKAKNAKKYPDGGAAVKAKVISAWKAKIDKKGPPSATKVYKTETAPVMTKVHSDLSFLTLGKTVGGSATDDGTEDFLDLRKGLHVSHDLTSAFSSIRTAQRQLMMEGRGEKDSKDTAMANRLGALARDLSSVLSDKALHEGGEAVTMTDTDDHWVNQSLGKDKGMSKMFGGAATTTAARSVDDLLKAAISDALVKAARPNPLDCMKSGRKTMKSAKKAMADAKDDIEKAHSILKARFMAKAAGKKPAGDDGDGDDDAECMKALTKAFASLDKAMTMTKSAKDFFAKAEGVMVENGNEFYEVPAGVRTMTAAEIAAAPPGTKGGGSQPPLYPDDGSVYPGKANKGSDLAKYVDENGMVPVGIVEVFAKVQAQEAELEVLRNMPRGGSRPHPWNMQKAMTTLGGAEVQEARTAMFKGVDVSAIGSGDENAHTKAVGDVITNMITDGRFGRSIMDSSFHGTAGGHA